MRAPAIFLLLLAFACPGFAGGPKIEQAKLTAQGRPRVYYFYVPPSATDAPAPLLLLLHGSGRSGRTMVESWKKLADKEGLILAGPDATNPAAWTTNNDSPAALRDIIEDVKTRHAVDPQRIYLFGHSAGAQFGLLIACLESEYFAAAAVHAGALWPEEFNVLLPLATRKIPLALWSGDGDRLVPLKLLQSTVAELKNQHFPVDLHVMPGHDHNYYAVSDKVNEAAWEFLKVLRVEKPQFTEYQSP